MSDLSKLAYPLDVCFKLSTLKIDCDVRDAHGKRVAYVHQKMFKWIEEVHLFRDDKQHHAICDIHADRWLDFNAAYRITGSAGESWGWLLRQGVKSLWAAHYKLGQDAAMPQYTIQHSNVWSSIIADSFLEDIPLIGELSSYVLHPKYMVKNRQGQECFLLQAKASFWSGRRFKIQKLAAVKAEDEALIVAGLIMVMLLERE